MSDLQDDRMAPLVRGLDEASRTLADLHSLTRPEADRIGARIDRLTSRLTNMSPSGRADPLDEIDHADG